MADEVNGTWGNAIEVPGGATLNSGGVAFISSLSCGSAGNCAAGGEYAYAVSTSSGPSYFFQPFVVSEVNGTWGNAIPVPGTPANAGGFDVVASISCQSAANCVAGLSSAVGNTLQAFVVSEANGTWGEAIQVPGLNSPTALVNAVSCPPNGGCSAGGDGTGASGGQAFVVSQG